MANGPVLRPETLEQHILSCPDLEVGTQTEVTGRGQIPLSEKS